MNMKKNITAGTIGIALALGVAYIPNVSATNLTTYNNDVDHNNHHHNNDDHQNHQNHQNGDEQ